MQGVHLVMGIGGLFESVPDVGSNFAEYAYGTPEQDSMSVSQAYWYGVQESEILEHEVHVVGSESDAGTGFNHIYSDYIWGSPFVDPAQKSDPAPGSIYTDWWNGEFTDGPPQVYEEAIGDNSGPFGNQGTQFSTSVTLDYDPDDPEKEVDLLAYYYVRPGDPRYPGASTPVEIDYEKHEGENVVEYLWQLVDTNLDSSAFRIVTDRQTRVCELFIVNDPQVFHDLSEQAYVTLSLVPAHCTPDVQVSMKRQVRVNVNPP
jgi:hypothetical protein